jgi:hypothetical protein
MQYRYRYPMPLYHNNRRFIKEGYTQSFIMVEQSWQLDIFVEKQGPKEESV